MPKNKPEEWEKELDVLVQCLEWSIRNPHPWGYGTPDMNSLKAFIRNLLKEERARVLEEVEKVFDRYIAFDDKLNIVEGEEAEDRFEKAFGMSKEALIAKLKEEK